MKVKRLTPKLKWFIVQTTLLWLVVCVVALNVLGTAMYWLSHRRVSLQALALGFRSLRYFGQAFALNLRVVQVVWGSLLALLFIVFIPALRRISNERRQYEQRDDYASHGTSRFMTKAEVKQFFYKAQRGILMGSYDAEEYWPIKTELDADKDVRPSRTKSPNRPKQAADQYAIHPFDDPVLNNQYLIIGPPGSQKTTGFVLPNIFHLLQQGASIVVTDTKGEVYKLTSNYAREHGYQVCVLDYIYFSYGDRLNTLQYIRSETDIATIANIFMKASMGKDEKEDFWSQKAQSLLVALIGYVLAKREKHGTWGDVYDCLVDADLLDPERGPEMIEQSGLIGLAAKEYKAFIRGADEVREGIIATLGSRMQSYGIDDVRRQCATTDFDMASIGYEKTIMYIWISDSNTAFRAQSSVLWTTFYNTMYEAARRTNDKLDLVVVPIMEEMANIGRIGDYLTKLTTMRGRGLKPLHIWHSIPQLQSVYGKEEAAAFMGACDTTIVLGNNDLETAKILSELVGDTTIRVANQGEKTASALNTRTEQQTYQGRRLMQPSELRALDNRFTLVLQRGRPVVLLKKAQYKYWKHQVCPPADLDTLTKYGRGLRLEEEPDYSFLRAATRVVVPPLTPDTEDFLDQLLSDSDACEEAAGDDSATHATKQL